MRCLAPSFTTITRHARSATIGALLLFAAHPGTAQRTLHWRSLDVTARLDAEGRLHVVERQEMVFSGDWNGGERTFRLEAGQRLELRAIRRIDPASGAVTELVKGDLEEVDRYQSVSGDAVRWRSRLPSDPPFDDAVLLYELDYVLSRILVVRDGSYRLSHDFAFPDRVGVIERFRLDLTLDPVWRSPSAVKDRIELHDLEPGRGVVLTYDLEHTGPNRPAAVLYPVRAPLRGTLVLAGLATIVALLIRLVRFERRQGRFASSRVAGRAAGQSVDRAVLEEHLLPLLPEVAGAIWDRSIGAPEVVAVLARLESEGKLRSRVRKSSRFWFASQVLELELLVDHKSFSGYERKLIKKLFFGRRTRTDTRALQKHYSKSGFSPASLITPELDRAVRALPGFGRALAAPRKRTSLLLMLAIVVALLLEGFDRGINAAVALGLSLLLVTTLPALVANLAAYHYRKKALGLWGAALIGLVALAACAAACLRLALDGHVLAPLSFGVDLGLFGVLAATLVPVTLANSLFNIARTRESKAAVAKRKILATIRDAFRAELRKPAPDLEDAWYPYLVAFGLAGKIDRWFRRFGGTPTAATSVGSGALSGSRGGSASSSGPQWTGGGGSFGGAGATAAWTSAAVGLASGVTAASSGSSGGGGGGGGGGGSSGGGGGGGW